LKHILFGFQKQIASCNLFLAVAAGAWSRRNRSKCFAFRRDVLSRWIVQQQCARWHEGISKPPPACRQWHYPSSTP
ncbi:MAG: hypothetical protein LBB52_07665, partial [Desulfovibrio sp.]|nr:hypothetical protein [Desulfovibrio sp.]